MLKEKIEERNAITSKLDALDALVKEEKRSFTSEETESYGELSGQEAKLKKEVLTLEAREARAKDIVKNVPVAGGKVQDLNKDEKRAAKDFDFIKAVGEAAAGGNFSGLEKEVIQEGLSEARSGKLPSQGLRIVVPQKFMSLEKRTDIDQATSAIAPTFLGQYTDALREESIFLNMPGVNVYNLTADFKLPVTAAQTLAWATAENSSASDSGANFAKDTLTPFRFAGYVDISNEITVQNGPAATQAIMKDLGRSAAALQNTAMLSTAAVTNAPPSLAATSGVLTFTEAAYSAGASVLSDLQDAEYEVANDHGLGGNLAYALSTELLKEIKKSVAVTGILAGMNGRTYNDYNINGYMAKFTTGATKIAGTSGDGIFGDWSRVHYGTFGGLNILVDPYTVAGNNQIRLVVNSMVDWSLVQGASFVKFTSLTA
jgi:HK97 family phage major capsid protein